MSTEQQQWDIVTGVGMTALAVAAGRAIETERADALISDPYAHRLVTAAEAETPLPTRAEEIGGEVPHEQLWASTAEYMGVRSRVFDDALLRAAGEGALQVVILASGLDTRPFRLDWPAGTHCYELDQPAVVDFKLGVLREEGAEPRCGHTPVRIDLRDDWASALETAGFDRSRPTAWLAEGLLPYLPPDAEARLFKEITRLSAPGSRLVVEQVNDVLGFADDPMMRDSADAMGVDIPSLFPEGPRETVDAQLRGLGWEVRHVPGQESAAGLGRTLDGSALFSENIVHTFAELA